MPISVLSEVTGYAFQGGGGGGADLTPPANPAPVTLAAGATALPSTLIGSWSAPVTVVATCTTGSGAPGPAVTVTGSGAGPYSVAIASGLTTATSYIVTIEGTGADGQVAETCLLVVVAGVVGDLTAPAAPSPSNLPAGSTALGATSIGSWSASVTVSSLVLASGGPAPTATITGSGAGPYSVSIASGLSDATSYLVILTGTGADGQVASTSLLVAVASPADLTAPAPPAPVSLAAGTTALGTTALGSWSAPVTVAATAAGSDGSTPAVTLTGSGAGPYSVAVASGLSDGVTYTVTAAGTGADGQVSRTALAVAVRDPAIIIGSIDWTVAADYDFTQVVTSSRVVTSGTVPSGVVGLPDWTLASDNGAAYGVTPTNGVGLVLDVTSATARGYVYFTPNWAGIGINQAGTEAYAVELQLTSPSYGGSAFTSFMVGSSANPNGSGSGAGGRVINSGGNRNGNARSYSSGTSELSALIFTSASDPAAVSFLGGFVSGETANSVLSGSLPVSGPAAYTLYRDGANRAINTTSGYSPGFVSLLYGGGIFSNGAISRVRIWTRAVV